MLTELDFVDVYYGNQKRRVVLCSGDLSNLEEEDNIDYLAVSSLPNDYSPSTNNWLIANLDQAGVSVEALSTNKLADYRPDIPCWVSHDVAGANFQRVVVFEPTVPSVTSYDYSRFIFSAVKEVQGESFIPTTVALPLVSTVTGGADEVRMLEYLFFAAAGRCGRAEEFSEIKITLYETSTDESVLLQAFQHLKEAYNNIEINSYFSDYATYSLQAQEHINSITIPEYLTYRQAFGICMYTTNFYSTINSILRSDYETSDDFKHLQALLEAIDTGLHNCPVAEQTGFRGESYVTESRLLANEPTGQPVNLAYTSSAYRVGEWYNSAPFQFDIESLSGSVVQYFSIYPNEDELLFPRLMKYYVNARTINDKYKFDCSEILQKYNKSTT